MTIEQVLKDAIKDTDISLEDLMSLVKSTKEEVDEEIAAERKASARIKKARTELIKALYKYYNALDIMPEDEKERAEIKDNLEDILLYFEENLTDSDKIHLKFFF